MSNIAPSQQVELNVQAEQAYNRGRVDINFFAALALPDVSISALPSFYCLIFQMLAHRKVEDMGRILRFALGLPRSHAKTTFIKILICWLIVYDKVYFILVVCANEPLAENLIADISDILGSPNMEAIYGSWASSLTTDRTDLKKAIYHGRHIIIAAKGAGSSLRGINIKNRRPDLIFCDDMQTRENDESYAERTKLITWFTATLLKCIAPRGDRLIIYVGNMYSDECLLYLLQTNPLWHSLVTGAILDNGQPLWPELFSLQDLKESFEHDESLGHGTVWFAEIMNDPRAAKRSLLPLPLPVNPYEDTPPDACFITIDPAGFKKDSDDNVISVHYVCDGRGVVRERVIGGEITDPEQLVLKALSKAVEHNATLIGVEDAGYQSTLQFWFHKYLTAAGITGISIVPLKPKNRSKESRIRLFIEDMYAGNWYQSNAARPAFVYQAMKYKLGKTDNKDDVLDCDAYALDVRNEYWHLVGINKMVRAQSLGSFRVIEHNTPF
jgi:hypothetical protein